MLTLTPSDTHDLQPGRAVRVICTGLGTHHLDPDNPCELAYVVAERRPDGSFALRDSAFRQPGRWTDEMVARLSRQGRTIPDLGISPFRTTPDKWLTPEDETTWNFICRVCGIHDRVDNRVVNAWLGAALAAGTTTVDIRPPR